MRRTRRLLRGIVATTLGLTLTTTAAPLPARASAADYQGYVTVILNIYEMGKDGLSPLELTQLVEQMIALVNGTKSDVLMRLDEQLVNEIRSQTASSLSKVEMLRVPWLAGPAVNGMHDAAIDAKEHLATVRGNDLALDAVGRAMIALFNQLYAVYLVIDADEGSRLAPVVPPLFREGLEYLVREMAPECTPGGYPNGGLRTYTCRFGGKTVRAEHWALTDQWTVDGSDPIPGAISQSIVQEIVMKDTVWYVANQTLDALKRQGVPLP